MTSLPGPTYDLSSGKSTLLNLLSGKLKPFAGEVTRHRHLRIGRYDQHFHELLPLEKSPCEFLRSEYDVPEQQARKVPVGFLGFVRLCVCMCVFPSALFWRSCTAQCRTSIFLFFYFFFPVGACARRLALPFPSPHSHGSIASQTTHFFPPPATPGISVPLGYQ